jgi:hypothetical protein
MYARQILTAALVGLAAGAGLVLGTPSAAEAASSSMLRRTVVVGDSILAGFGNGGLVFRGVTGQRDAAPALLARQAHVRLPQPLMRGPGVPPPLRIDDANANGQLDAGEVRPSSDLIGFRRDPGRSVRNLAVPGESIDSVFQTLETADVAERLVSDDIEGRDILKFLILGLPLRDDPVSQLTRAGDLRPSFLLVWLGNNDVLPMATMTDPGAATMSAAQFGQRYRRFLDRLADTGAAMAVANLPDVTQIAALRRAGDTVTSCRHPDGTTEPVAPDALLPLALDPARLPVPGCARVLDATERAAIRATVMAFNAEIEAAIADVEQQRGVPIARVDAFTLFDDIAQHGSDVRGDGSLVLTTSYLGGIFGLDGTHPTRTGQALIANAFIAAINARYAEAIPAVDVSRIAARDPLVGSAYRPAGEAPFGLIAGQDADVGDALDEAFDRVKDRGRDVFDDLRRRTVRDVFDRIADLF